MAFSIEPGIYLAGRHGARIEDIVVMHRRRRAAAQHPPDGVGAAMTVERILPNDDAAALLELATDLADRELAPRVDDFEERGEFPREVIRTIGRSGLLGLPYAEAYGGAGQPYEVYLQVLEVLASRWLAVAEAVSVHTLACYPLAAFGSDEQRDGTAAGHARRRTARRLLPLRAAGRLRRRPR